MKEYEVLRASDWLDQSRSGDSMKGRVVLLAWKDEDGKTLQISTNEQWEDSRDSNWDNPEKPNYCFGHYFADKITDEALVNFYERSAKLFGHYIGK